MNKTLFFLIFAINFIPLSTVAQSTVDPSAAFEIDSTTKGFLPPRMSTAQRNALSRPATGLTIYNTDTFTLNVYSGLSWVQVGSTVNGVIPITTSTGKVWLDRNLGASRVASSSTDSDAYGDLYQWGRNTDGHQLRTNTATTSGPVSSGSEGGNFVTSSSGNNYDWLSSRDDTRWNGSTKGTHDPCPNGFRVPTNAEWNAELSSLSITNAATAFSSDLKLTISGYRFVTNASFVSVGVKGYYWTSNVNGTDVGYVLLTSTAASVGDNVRGHGFSVRCIEE